MNWLAPAPRLLSAAMVSPPIPADFWAAWSRKYAEFPLLKNGLIFAQSTLDKATGQAREQAALRTGVEPLNPATPAPGITPV